MKYNKTLLFVGAVLAALTLTLSSVSAKSVKPVFDKAEYNEFFSNLSDQEKIWIMDLAVWYYDADKSNVGLFPRGERLSLLGLKPVPDPVAGPDVPETLVFQFLNGDIPKDFAKSFTKWLSEEFDLTPKNYERYRSEGTFCDPEVDRNCKLVDLHNIGGICCPFG